MRGALACALCLAGSASLAAAVGTPGGQVARPACSTGDGFFVSDGTLYDPEGHAFRIRGVNRVHWDSNSALGIAKSHANTVRWNLDFTRSPAFNAELVRAQSVRLRNVPIVGNWAGTCSPDPAKLTAMVSTWVAQERAWSKLSKYLIVNIANEWGPANSTVWRDSYISAVASLRRAGYLNPLLIDSGGCGQDEADLVQYSQAVFNSDPQRNIMFAEHLYGGTNDHSATIRSIQKGNPTIITINGTSSTHPFAPSFNGSNNSYSGTSAYWISGVQGMTQINGKQPAPTNVGGSPGSWTITLSVDSSQWSDYTGGGTIVDYWGNYQLKIGRLAALSKATGAVYLIGEFGPGRNIGPSPTSVTPAQILSTAEADGIGWLAWAWDDNNLPGARANDAWFSMTYSGPGIYTRPSDLTAFGKEVVLNPTYGITALARPASIFGR